MKLGKLGKNIGTGLKIAGSMIPGVGTYLGAREQAKAQEQANAMNLQMSREGNEFNERMQEDAQEFNAKQAQTQRDYETNMSNTAYQRATADMQKAGINPMLAYMQGGAGTPNVSSASSGMTSANVAKVDPVDAFGKGLSSMAANSIGSALEFKQLNEAINRIKAEKLNVELDNKAKNLQMPAVQAEADKRKKVAEITGSKGFIITEEIINKLFPVAASALAIKKLGDFGQNKFYNDNIDRKFKILEGNTP